MPYIATRGPGRPPAAKAAETRERILRAAREVFSELGYDAATFQAIAIRADLTRPAINHCFANKRVLYGEVLDQTNAMVVAAGRRRAEEETTFIRRLSSFFVAAIQADSEDRSAAAFLVTSILEAQRHPELRQEVLKVMQNLAESGMTMIVVTHEMGFARKVGTRLIFMEHGHISVDGNPVEMIDNPSNPRLRDFLQHVE